jgi:hypothetical protein
MFVATILLLQLAATPPLDLEVNEARLIPLPAGAVVSIENPKIVAASDAGQGELLIEALMTGKTRVTLTVGKTVNVQQIQVTPSQRAKKAAELRSLVSPQEGLTLGVERDGTPWAECRDCDPLDLQGLNEVILMLTPVRMVDRITPPPDPVAVMNGVLAILGEKKGDVPGLILDIRQGRVVLFGSLHSAEDRRRVALASLRFPSMRVHVAPELIPLPREP